MPHLNWRDRDEIQKQITEPVPGVNPCMQLRLSAAQVGELCAQLTETMGPEGSRGELRVDLPDGWIVFWKPRDGDSRLLVAHPQPEEWVVTVALHDEHAAALLEALRRLGPGGELKVHELGAPFGLSNLELILKQG